jgi:hypothetical protein
MSETKTGRTYEQVLDEFNNGNYANGRITKTRKVNRKCKRPFRKCSVVYVYCLNPKTEEVV